MLLCGTVAPTIILTDDPRPVRDSLLTPQFIHREIESFQRRANEQAAMRRLMDLRESVGLPVTVTGKPIGKTVSIRLPQRFAVSR